MSTANRYAGFVSEVGSESGHSPAPSRDRTNQLVGSGQWVRWARRAAVAHGAHDNPVVISGEAGTGKELLARLIHEHSARQKHQFVTFSADALSIESAGLILLGRDSREESWGSPHRGLIDSARGGTLYIDGTLAVHDSVGGRLEPLVGGQSAHPDTRLIFGVESSRSAHRAPSLLEGIRDVLFVPALRDRKEDVEPLARSFLASACLRLNREMRQIEPEVLDALSVYDWPGNVAELRDTIYSMVERAQPPRISLSLLPGHIARAALLIPDRFPESGIDLGREIDNIERLLISAALRRSRGVQNRAARLLGLKPTTLNTKISRYGIDVSGFR